MEDDTQDTTGNGTKEPWPLSKTLILWVGLTLLILAVVLIWLLGAPWDWGDRSSQVLLQTVQAVVLSLGFLGVVGGSVIAYRRHETERETVGLQRAKQEHDRVTFIEQQAESRERSRHERFAQGAAMLAESAPALQIAGLNIIAGVGREVAPSEEYRQVSIDIICAFLRALSANGAHSEDEMLAAREACIVLPTLFDEQPKGDDNALLGAPRLNLSNAILYDFSLMDSLVEVADFAGARFIGPTRFGQSQFLYARFSHATFEKADFDTSVFEVALFDQVHFESRLSFRSAFVRRLITFERATFDDWAFFSGTAFHGTASFKGAQCSGVSFRGAHLEDVEFVDCLFKVKPETYGGCIDLVDTQFAFPHTFRQALFPDLTGPDDLRKLGVQQSNLPQFKKAHFGEEAYPRGKGKDEEMQ